MVWPENGFFPEILFMTFITRNSILTVKLFIINIVNK
jgi:hypothetical protein